ncbi:MAG: alanyl-tRNA editing protein [Blastocatellia bacterium]
MSTTKLYRNDSHLTQFSACIADSWLEGGQRVVALDQTAFYPAGGGQPCDTGKIGSAEVVDVVMADDERILHRLGSNAELAVGENVLCVVDWPRRLEMMQQHTGQHILSQAFFQLFGAETKGFRITANATEIDLTLEAHPEEIEQSILRAEDLANRVVFENRAVRVHEVTPEEAARLPLRKESFVADCIRVVEIDGYDWSPCGGTHAKRTGEVGLIAVKNWERAKQMTRVHFVCGLRALGDYRSASRTADAIARRFTVGREEAEGSVVRLMEENKRLARRVRVLAEVAAKIEAHEMFAAVEPANGLRIVTHVFDDRDFEEAKLIAHRLAAGDDVVALLATREAGMARLVFARSANVAADMNALMKLACERLGGRGGGKPDFAQGGGAQMTELNAALETARAAIVH